jgi:DNA-directed RNA polymerase specialized sigma24 family protein
MHGQVCFHDAMSMNQHAVEVAILQVVEGDTEAFAVVVDAYGPLLQAWAVARCSAALDPDEIAHRTFI